MKSQTSQQKNQQRGGVAAPAFISTKSQQNRMSDAYSKINSAIKGAPQRSASIISTQQQSFQQSQPNYNNNHVMLINPHLIATKMQQQYPPSDSLHQHSQQRTLSFNNSTYNHNQTQLVKQEWPPHSHQTDNKLNNSNNRMLVGLRYPSQILRNEQLNYSSGGVTTSAFHTTQYKSPQQPSNSSHKQKAVNVLNITPPTKNIVQQANTVLQQHLIHNGGSNGLARISYQYQTSQQLQPAVMQIQSTNRIENDKNLKSPTNQTVSLSQLDQKNQDNIKLPALPQQNSYQESHSHSVKKDQKTSNDLVNFNQNSAPSSNQTQFQNNETSSQQLSRQIKMKQQPQQQSVEKIGRTNSNTAQPRNLSALKKNTELNMDIKPLFVYESMKTASVFTENSNLLQIQQQIPAMNLDFGQYDCGDEPSEEEDMVDEQSSISSLEQENEAKVNCAKSESSSDNEAIKQKTQIQTIENNEKQKLNAAEIQQQLVSGDIFLLGGSHVLQSQNSTDTSSNSSTVTELLKRKKKSKRKSLIKSQERAIQEEEEKQEDEEDDIMPQQPKQAQTGNRATKLAEREAYLLRPPNQTVTLIKSQFAGKDPSVFFPYPPYLKIQRQLPHDMSRIVQHNQKDLPREQWLGFKFHHSTHTYNGVVNSLKMAGFHHMPQGNTWNILWTGLFKVGRIKNLNQYQHVNHFAGSWCIGRKDLMWRNVQRMRRIYGTPFEIAPTTYILPEDYKRWCADREINNFKSMYIMKPAASSCGRGIKVIGKRTHVNKRSGYIVSKYVSKPHLIRGFKYDLRVYVLVTSFEPLKIYIFKEGLVRLATVPYTTSKSSLKQRFIHLTNYSVNKKAETYQKNNATSTENAGETQEAPQSKLSFTQLRQEYEKIGANFELIFEKIRDVIIKTILSVENPIVTSMGGTKYKQKCFEIYGFDILIDRDFKPWLLEVNVSPSLSSSSPMDKYIKTLLLSDSLYLTGFHLFDRKQLEKDKAKQDKQRLLGFDSQKSNLTEIQSSNLLASPITSKFAENQLVNTAAKMQSKFQNSTQKASKQKHLQYKQPQWWLRDIPPLEGAQPSGGAGTTTVIAVQDGFLCTTEQDLDILVQFEEEMERQGHFNLIFPLKHNIDIYRPFFSLQRRSNIVLWSYIKQNQPIEQLKRLLM